MPSVLSLEAQSVWCWARISSEQAMTVSTMSWNSPQLFGLAGGAELPERGWGSLVVAGEAEAVEFL